MPNITVLPYIIKGGLHTYSFLSNMFTTAGPSDDPFVPLYSSNGHHDISGFVCSQYEFAKNSSDPSWSLSARFLVSIIGIGKAGWPVQHESFALWCSDEDTRQKKEFVLERVPSDKSYTSRFSSFSRFSDSDQVLTSILKVIQNMRSITAQTAVSLVAALETETEAQTETEAENIPLLPLTSESRPTLATLATSQTDIPPLSLKDRVTSSLAKAVAVARSGSQSISPQSLAQDSIRGFPQGSMTPDDCILTFKPVGLTVFDVVLIAKVVHDYAPIYGLFDNQCYMFVRVIFDVIVQLYSLPPSAFEPNRDHASTSIPKTPVPAPSLEVGTPKNANVAVVPAPDSEQTGRWAGLLIVDPTVKLAIVSIVIARFKAERALYAL